MEILLSIVIANYNYGRFLPLAIKSITRQCEEPVRKGNCVLLPIKECENSAVELIICDAKSSDNSVSIIQENAHCVSWWCSEKDSGQSEAFNKGFAHANGIYITWLNADDQYLDGTFIAFARKVREKKYPLWVTGNFLEFNVDSGCISFVSWGPHCQPPFLTKQHIGIYVFGPSSFLRRDVYNRIGPIDESLHYTMDLDYWTRLTMVGICQTRLNFVCWAFGIHEQSKSTGTIAHMKDSPGHLENVARYKKYGHRYKYSFSNPWYCLWILFRILDCSMLVRFWKRIRIIGCRYDTDSCKVSYRIK